jgi:rifampicin phosphotransferase
MQRPDPESMIQWLGRADPGAELGGKGSSLDRLARLGFRVPPGFCLTTDAFRVHLASIDGADALLRDLVAGGDHAVGAILAETLTRAPLEPRVDDALASAVAQLDATARAATGSPTRLAVRSSAIGEDGQAASYAGLHETELDRTPEEVADAVKRCWASLWSRAALAYRSRRGLALDGAAMAVVVQQLVPADAAVVAFTRHPVTGREDQVVVTAVRGLGDAMVSGIVTPDTFVVDKPTRRVVEFTPGDAPERSLDASALDALVELCLLVEERFGAAVDIEAATSGGEWYLLQARPITVVPGRP